MRTRQVHLNRRPDAIAKPTDFSVVEVEHTDSYAIATVEPFADRATSGDADS